MSLKTLEDLFVHELRDLYSAEKQLVKGLPKMAHAASSRKLREGFEEHQEQTKVHVERLEQIFKELELVSRASKCTAMEVLIEEGESLIAENADECVKDAALIGAAQKIEHYEIASYGTLRTWANILGYSVAVTLLQETLDEEKEAHSKLNDLAESEVNAEAAQAGA